MKYNEKEFLEEMKTLWNDLSELKKYHLRHFLRSAIGDDRTRRIIDTMEQK